MGLMAESGDGSWVTLIITFVELSGISYVLISTQEQTILILILNSILVAIAICRVHDV